MKQTLVIGLFIFMRENVSLIEANYGGASYSAHWKGTGVNE